MVSLITCFPIASQENPGFFPCNKGGAGILFFFYRRDMDCAFLGSRGDLKQQKEEFNE
jgi:hypothetical protein